MTDKNPMDEEAFWDAEPSPSRFIGWRSERGQHQKQGQKTDVSGDTSGTNEGQYFPYTRRGLETHKRMEINESHWKRLTKIIDAAPANNGGLITWTSTCFGISIGLIPAFFVSFYENGPNFSTATIGFFAVAFGLLVLNSFYWSRKMEKQNTGWKESAKLVVEIIEEEQSHGEDLGNPETK